MEPLKLLALDMDGTLLDSKKQISPRTLAVLRGLSDAGVIIAAATGRCLAEMRDYLGQLSFVRWGVLDSGAMICDFKRSETLRLRPMPLEDTLACLSQCGREDAMPHLLCVRESVVRESQVHRLAEYNHADHQAAFERICLRVEDMEAYIRSHSDEILKVCMYHRDTESRGRSLEALKGTGMALTFSGRTSLEAVAPGVDKGYGLKTLASLLGLKTSECAAVGDDDNDLAMFGAAGLSAAMGNAPERVRKAADMTVADNDHDGAAEAAERMFAALTDESVRAGRG